eukprot:scaffold273994_cov28-Tisochrysis_lutea.AAC.2
MMPIGSDLPSDHGLACLRNGPPMSIQSRRTCTCSIRWSTRTVKGVGTAHGHVGALVVKTFSLSIAAVTVSASRPSCSMSRAVCTLDNITSALAAAADRGSLASSATRCASAAWRALAASSSAMASSVRRSAKWSGVRKEGSMSGVDAEFLSSACPAAPTLATLEMSTLRPSLRLAAPSSPRWMT